MSDMDPAIEALRQAVKLAPDNVDLINHLCQTLMSFGKNEEAETRKNRNPRPITLTIAKTKRFKPVAPEKIVRTL